MFLRPTTIQQHKKLKTSKTTQTQWYKTHTEEQSDPSKYVNKINKDLHAKLESSPKAFTAKSMPSSSLPALSKYVTVTLCTM